MKTDKTCKKLLNDLNLNKISGPVITRVLSECVEMAKIWERPIAEGLESQIFKAYLIKVKELYIGLVYEVEANLYAYLIPKYRKQGKMSGALISTILPHLLQQKPIIRTELNISILGSERSYTIAKRLAKKVGFRALVENNNECRMTMDASALLERKYIRGNYLKLPRKEMQKMITTIQYTIGLLEVTQSELEYKCGFSATSEALNDIIKKLENFIPWLKSAKFLEQIK